MCMFKHCVLLVFFAILIECHEYHKNWPILSENALKVANNLSYCSNLLEGTETADKLLSLCLDCKIYVIINDGLPTCYHLGIVDFNLTLLWLWQSDFSLGNSIILPVILYGCETWSLTLRDEHRLRVFENRVLRRIFGPKRDEVTGSWRKLHNEELHNLYSSPSIIRMIKSRRMRLIGHVARMGRILCI
jgi:hypothetical protein